MRLTCWGEEEAGRKEAQEVVAGYGSDEPTRETKETCESMILNKSV